MANNSDLSNNDLIDTTAKTWWFFHFHNWSRWEDTEKGTISRNDTVIGKYLYQERRCTHCNKVELNRIKIT